MIRPALFALGVLALALLGLTAWELGGVADEDARAPAGLRVTARMPPPAQPTSRPPDLTPLWVARILARPLFNQDRRPAPPAAPGAAATAAVASLPRLAGILISPADRRAIFAAEADGKPVVLREGGALAGFTINAIGPEGVTIDGPQGKQTLRPSFDAHPQPATTDAIAPPQPGMPGTIGLPGVPGMNVTPGMASQFGARIPSPDQPPVFRPRIPPS